MDRVLWIAEPGAYQDLDRVLPKGQEHILSTPQEFLAKIKTKES